MENRFPIKVKDVTISVEEYENTIKWIERLEKALTETNDRLEGATKLFNELGKEINFEVSVKDPFNIANEVFISNGIGGTSVQIRSKEKWL